MTTAYKIPTEQKLNTNLLYLISAVVVALSAGYFLLSYTRTLNPVDEGYLLNNCVKVAQGQVPHRDFYDDYGPASFWLGGALFKLFGVKVIVIRIFLVIMKSAMALLIFLIGRKLLPLTFALIAAGLFTLNWGDPYLPAINILYAGYVCHFLALLGILFMMMYVESGRRLWLIATSALLGFSLLFKFPSAIFDFIAFSVFLSLKEVVWRSQPIEDDFGEEVPAVRLYLLRGGKLLGLLSVIIFYLALFSVSHLDFYYFFIFLLPYYLLLAYTLWSEIRAFRTDRSKTAWRGLRKCYMEIAILVSGPVLFFILEIAYYSLVNGLDEFFYDSFILPLHINFYHPMVDVRLHAILIALVSAAVVVFIYIGKKLSKAPERLTALWVCSLMPLVALPAALVLRGTTLEEWHLRANHVIPPVTLLLSAILSYSFYRQQKRKRLPDKEALLLVLVVIFGCQNFLQAFPRIDETHIQFSSIVLFILLAYLLWRVYRSWQVYQEGGGHVRGLISAILLLALLSSPQLWGMKLFYVFNKVISEEELKKVPIEVQYLLIQDQLKYYPMLHFDFPVSRGITVPLWLKPPLTNFVIKDMRKVIHYIRKNSGENDRILVIGESQIVYLLSERKSIIPREDYFLFLAATELLGPEDTQKLPDEDFLKRVEESQPKYIVQSSLMYSEHSKRVAAIWPRTYHFIEDNYATAEKFGDYIILKPKP